MAMGTPLARPADSEGLTAKKKRKVKWAVVGRKMRRMGAGKGKMAHGTTVPGAKEEKSNKQGHSE
jgi:hypothetical protein